MHNCAPSNNAQLCTYPLLPAAVCLTGFYHQRLAPPAGPLQSLSKGNTPSAQPYTTNEDGCWTSCHRHTHHTLLVLRAAGAPSRLYMKNQQSRQHSTVLPTAAHNDLAHACRSKAFCAYRIAAALMRTCEVQGSAAPKLLTVVPLHWSCFRQHMMAAATLHIHVLQCCCFT